MLEDYIRETGITEKKCSVCRQVLPLSKFAVEPLRPTKGMARKRVEYRHRPKASCMVCSAKRGRYTVYKNSAKASGRVFTLSKELFYNLLESDCYYCGDSPSGKAECNGIDRVDNSRGYEEDNVVPCCSICNTAKSTLPLDEWIRWTGRVAKGTGSYNFPFNHIVVNGKLE
jgi:hypothetical protein